MSKAKTPLLKPVLVAIAGGSGSGKTWLARNLEQALAPLAIRLSLDDFYLDRSHLSPARRARVNFDHPRAIDWPQLMRVLRTLLAGRNARVPCYDFKTHCRLRRQNSLVARPIILLEGLWVLRHAELRALFSLKIFLDSPFRTRLRRRMARDRVARGRTRASIRRQFHTMVEPMHARYVAPQAGAADVIFKRDCSHRQVRGLARLLKQFCPCKHPN